MGTPMLNQCPGDKTVPKHIFGSKNLSFTQIKKKVISCFCLILEYFKTLIYHDLYDFLSFFAKKLKKLDTGHWKQKKIKKSRKIKELSLPFSISIF